MWMWPWERINLHKALVAMAAELDRNHNIPAKQYRRIAKSFVKRAADDTELRKLIIGHYIHNMEWPEVGRKYGNKVDLANLYLKFASDMTWLLEDKRSERHGRKEQTGDGRLD